MKPKMVDIDTLSEEELAEHIGTAGPIDPPPLGKGLDEAIQRVLGEMTQKEREIVERRACNPTICPACQRKKKP